jgi:hypothetical protein
LIETPPLSSRLHHADHAALFSRVFGLVVDCCRSSHSTASASNRPRLLLSSSIDRSPIHRLTISRIVAHPRLLESAHSTPPQNSKSAHSASPVLWRVACNLRVAATTPTRQQRPTQQPAALHPSIATPPPHRCDRTDATTLVAYIFLTHRANDVSRFSANLSQHLPPCLRRSLPPPALSAPPRLRAVARRRVCSPSRCRPSRRLFHAMLTSSPDPNQPKRGLSAYMFFANDQRDKVREDNPGIKFGMLRR